MLIAIDCDCDRDAKEKAEAEKQRLIALEKVVELKKDSLIDDKFTSSTFNGSQIRNDNERQFRICRRYAEKFSEMLEKNQGLLLWGNVGTGKSHVAACIANHVMQELHTVYAMNIGKLFQSDKMVDMKPIIEKMAKAELALLDDLGVERDTSYGSEVVYNLIDSRYRQKKPMIVTTNLTLDEMMKEPNIRQKRIYDRILEVCYPVYFDGPSFRMMEANSRFKAMGKLLED